MVAPAPLEIGARMAGGAALVTWSQPPAPPEGRLAYDRVFSRYRVYRLNGDDQLVIGETTERAFRDPSPPAGAVDYVVTAVQRSGQEGARSDRARLAR